MDNNLINEFLTIQKQKNIILEQIENKFNTEIPLGIIKDYTNIKWKRKFNIFDNIEIHIDKPSTNRNITEIFCHKLKDTEILEYGEFIVFNCYRNKIDNDNWYYIDDPQCIVLLKNNEIK